MIRIRLLAIGCVLQAILNTQLLAAEADAERAVRTGREALGSSWRYPWYDGDQDGLRRVYVDPPAPSWNWQFNWLQEVIYYGAWIIGLATLAALIYLVVRTFVVRREAAMSNDAEATDTGKVDRARIEALPFELRTDGDLLAEARRLAAAGDFARAVIYLYSYELIELDRRQIIRLTRGKTNRQYLREAARQPGLRDLLEPCMIAFEDAFFGHCMLARERFEPLWAGQERLLALAGGGPTL